MDLVNIEQINYDVYRLMVSSMLTPSSYWNICLVSKEFNIIATSLITDTFQSAGLIEYLYESIDLNLSYTSDFQLGPIKFTRYASADCDSMDSDLVFDEMTVTFPDASVTWMNGNITGLDYRCNVHNCIKLAELDARCKMLFTDMLPFPINEMVGDYCSCDRHLCNIDKERNIRYLDYFPTPEILEIECTGIYQTNGDMDYNLRLNLWGMTLVGTVTYFSVDDRWGIFIGGLPQDRILNIQFQGNFKWILNEKIK